VGRLLTGASPRDHGSETTRPRAFARGLYHGETPLRSPAIVDVIKQIWDRIRTSLWFVPGLFALAAGLLAGATAAGDRFIPDEWLREVFFIYTGHAEGARELLATIATSIIGITGVVFSMTIVSLQLASSQFGPRLLRTFMRNRGSQVALGVFTGSFLYCIAVLPTIDASAEGSIPHVAVTLAVALAFTSVGVLVYYIHHVAQSIHADSVAEAVGHELIGVIENHFPAGDDSPERGAPDFPAEGADGVAVEANGHGYLRYVETSSMLALASEHGVRVSVCARPGVFVVPGDTLARVHADGSLGDDAFAKLAKMFVLGAHRTSLQDIPFAFEQLTEMAVRALSPGINDPTTAVHCVDQIGAGLCAVASRRRPDVYLFDEDDAARIRIPRTELAELFDAALDPIARNAGVHLSVWRHLLGTLEKVHARCADLDRRDETAARGRRLRERALESLPHEHDRSALCDAAAWAREGESV